MAATTLALPSRYSGTELIAAGGMAAVYVTTDGMLDRRVAVKILSERFAGDPEIQARFTREARIAARLSNRPNIVTVFDVTEVEGRPAIVMEYLPGGTIGDRMRVGRVPAELGLAWLAQAAAALDAAHAEGVVHRDVKPGNLMLAADGDLRVTDFGIARIAGDAALTSAGTILGTSGYMSPEQAVGEPATPASDRYALAVVAFELLTGRRPYLAETFAAEAAAHATAPIPAASSFDGSLPPAVDGILEKALAKDPELRYRSCAELGANLRAAFAGSTATTIRATPRPPLPAPVRSARAARPRWVAPLIALAAAGVVGLLFAAVVGGGDGSSAPTTVVRTATVAGQAEVRTVTVEAPPEAADSVTPAAKVDPASGAALNDQGYRLLRNGDPSGALPPLEQAVESLRGSGSLAEAYASYNLALARFSTGSCEGVEELLDRSEEIQGKREEIKRLRRDAQKGCRDD